MPMVPTGPAASKKPRRDPPVVAPKPEKRTFVAAIVCVESSLLARCDRK